MDSAFGFIGADYTLVAADLSVVHSIFKLKRSEDKILPIDSNKLMVTCGEHSERENFCYWIQKNIHLYKYRTGLELSTYSTANFARTQMADQLRYGPYEVNLLIAGFDKDTGPSLYWLDYLADMAKVTRASHGYGGFLLPGLLDHAYKPVLFLLQGMSLEEGLQLAKKCIAEIQHRLLLNQPDFVVKIVDQNGIREIDLKNV